MAGACPAAALSSAAPSLGAALNVIPAPARVNVVAGTFALGRPTRVYIPSDPVAAGSAWFFVELLRRVHPDWLEVIGARHARVPERAIEFALDPALPEASSESYRIVISPQRVLVSARDPRGLFYGAVTLWQLCTAARAVHECHHAARDAHHAMRRAFAGAA